MFLCVDIQIWWLTHTHTRRQMFFLVSQPNKNVLLFLKYMLKISHLRIWFIFSYFEIYVKTNHEKTIQFKLSIYCSTDTNIFVGLTPFWKRGPHRQEEGTMFECLRTTGWTRMLRIEESMVLATWIAYKPTQSWKNYTIQTIYILQHRHQVISTTPGF
jgi:hypothetical protein